MKKTQETITVNELASLANLTPRRIRQLASEDKIPRPARGKMPRDVAICALFSHFQRIPEQMQGERLKLVSATRETRELELEQAKGKFVLRAEARAVTEGALKKYHGFVRSEVENSGTSRRREKLASLGVDAGVLTAFSTFDIEDQQAAVDRIENRCQVETKEADAICI